MNRRTCSGGLDWHWVAGNLTEARRLERTNRAIGCADIRAARWRLERQEPVVNQTLAYHGLRLLASLFRYGEVDPHGAFVNLATGRAVALRVGPECWKRMRRRGRQLRRRRQAA